MSESMDHESPVRKQEAAPSSYGREQFEQETGVHHADEEYAAELAPPLSNFRDSVRPRADIEAFVEDDPAAASQNRTLGIVGLVLAAISLFFLPAVLGPASVVVGFAAYVRGNRTLGVWSMALGLLAVAAYYVLVPYYA
jgi:hypothetical protein